MPPHVTALAGLFRYSFTLFLLPLRNCFFFLRNLPPLFKYISCELNEQTESGEKVAARTAVNTETKVHNANDKIGRMPPNFERAFAAKCAHADDIIVVFFYYSDLAPLSRASGIEL